MKTITTLAIALTMLTGCFTSWAITQATGSTGILDERVREEKVPAPEVHERLRVSLPLAPATALAAGSEPAPFALECSSTQSSTNAVYHSAFRYGGTFRKIAAVFFLMEAGFATTYYFAADHDKPDTQLAVGYFALDALGTAALAITPRKEIFRRTVEPVVSSIRPDCPAGLLLEIAGETFPVDAAGRIGELGEAALDAWMKTPSTPIRVSYHEHVADLQIGQNEVCTWNRTRHQDQSACPGYWSSAPLVATSLEVPMGTLTRGE